MSHDVTKRLLPTAVCRGPHPPTLEVADYSKGDFPTPQVFGATTEDSLRLITCTGPWDSLAESYEDNRVVYATATVQQPSAAAG